MKGWNTKYPPSKFPVLAFTGVPGPFPVSEHNVHLQKYLKWSEDIENKANKFIQLFKNDEEEKFIGLHMRNGIDFVC
jgi:peptide-O-fucosyltransferase